MSIDKLLFRVYDELSNDEDFVNEYLKQNKVDINQLEKKFEEDLENFVKNKFINTAELRELQRKVNNDEITYSKMVELINEKAFNYYSNTNVGG